MITVQGKANVLFQDGKVGEIQELRCVQYRVSRLLLLLVDVQFGRLL